MTTDELIQTVLFLAAEIFDEDEVAHIFIDHTERGWYASVTVDPHECRAQGPTPERALLGVLRCLVEECEHKPATYAVAKRLLDEAGTVDVWRTYVRDKGFGRQPARDPK